MEASFWNDDSPIEVLSHSSPRGGSSPYSQIHLSYTFTVKGQEASQPSSLFNSVSSTKVIIVEIHCLFFESLPTKTNSYLTGPQRSNCHVGDILGLAFCPFGSSSKMALCFKVVSIHSACKL
jgi:hypothetical protein